ncbi:thermonuclease family protein [Pseudonocardia sp. RS11V-5]|uniref:thermonuclease family protein n=1 Tax=Pseudonocardia terrae TaxID=2905831 RepID=UPI001E2D2289|nr:thermonuclease family protein [Pseudonocardia terrae]MCE3551327.1 thermonuclease family protein [Pseudonocardia terrae]
MLGALAVACISKAEGERRSLPHECREGPPAYSARSTCQPGGEAVVVTRVVDGDTVELEDGSQIQLIGIDAPEADECGGADAASFVRRELTDQVVRVYADAEDGVDRIGRPLRYVRYGESAGSTKDLAHEMMRRGLVRRFPAYAGDPVYTVELQSAYETARAARLGIYGSTCVRVVSPRPDTSTSDYFDDRTNRQVSDRDRYRDVSPRPDDDDDVTAPRDDDKSDLYPGYTGPRCHLPGGETYRPC